VGWNSELQEGHPHRNHVLGIKAETDSEEVSKAAHHESRPGEQHQRERNLGHHEQASSTRAMMATRRGPGRGFRNVEIVGCGERFYAGQGEQ